VGLDLPVTRRATKLIPEYEVCGPNLRSVSFFSSFSVGVHNFFSNWQHQGDISVQKINKKSVRKDQKKFKKSTLAQHSCNGIDCPVASIRR
jgi:hypothetical protein